MLSSTQQSLDNTILNELLVSFIFVNSLAPPHDGFVGLVSLKLRNGLGDGFPIQTGLCFVDFLENHFLFKGCGF